MEIDYNLNSDSDDDEDTIPQLNNAPYNNNAARNKNLGNHIHDIERLKAQTNELLDPSWKEVRNRNLLHKMLELEVPTISPKMVDFLSQDGVCETLVNFITQVGAPNPRPGPSDPRTEEMKIAYKAVVLLTPDEPTESLLAILSKKSSIITRLIFEIFRDDSAGSFYHAYRIIDTLLRCFPADVYEGIMSNGKAIERISSMLRYIGYAPVHEILVVLIALTPIARNSQLYNTCARVRWNFLEQLRDWTLMLRITDAITSPHENCYNGGYVNAETHSTAGAQLMLDLIEKLSLEDTGEALLHPLGFETNILDKFIYTSVDVTVEDNIRRSAAKLLCFILRRAAEPEIYCIVNGQPGQPPQQTSIANRLYPLRERIVLYIETKLPYILASLSNFQCDLLSNGKAVEGEGSSSSGMLTISVKYSGYSIREPFTSLRASLVEILILMVESDEAVGATISVELWKSLMAWTVRYAFNSIYHALFYRLVFAVLRQMQEHAQRVLFQKAKLTTFLIDNYLPFPVENKDIPSKTAPEDVINRSAARGLMMNCLNAIRLQASCQPPSCFLRQFLASHQKWNDFQEVLIKDTDVQHRLGMGITIIDSKPNPMTGLAQIIEQKLEETGINHGSRFARSLGFYDDVAWPVDAADAIHDPALLPKVKKGKLKKVKRRSRSSSSSSPVAEMVAKLHPEDTHVPWDTSEIIEDYLEVDDESYPDSDSDANRESISDDDYSIDSDDSNEVFPGTPTSPGGATSYFLPERKSVTSVGSVDAPNGSADNASNAFLSVERGYGEDEDEESSQLLS